MVAENREYGSRGDVTRQSVPESIMVTSRIGLTVEAMMMSTGVGGIEVRLKKFTDICVVLQKIVNDVS